MASVDCDSDCFIDVGNTGDTDECNEGKRGFRIKESENN